MALLRLAAGGVLFAVVSLVFLALAIPLLPFRVLRVRLCNGYGKLCGRSIVWLARAQPRVAHPERLQGSNPAVFVTNHAATLDVFLGIWLCPWGACGVFKKEIVRVPFLGWLAVLSGHLLIDRRDHERAVKTLDEAARFLSQNRLGVWIFPEGTRSRDGRLQPFKKGFVHLAIQAGLPVVPVLVHGAHKSWRKGELPGIREMQLDVEVLEPIDTSAWRAETAAEHALAVQRLFEQGLREDQRPSTDALRAAG
jgi:1-acyl-sn-glycerol-3-phosphate acyltransferase